MKDLVGVLGHPFQEKVSGCFFCKGDSNNESFQHMLLHLAVANNKNTSHKGRVVFFG
jgi:hypothetical protein